MFFMPKEPPTLAVRMRTFSFGTFSVLASVARLPATPWVGTWIVKRSLALS